MMLGTGGSRSVGAAVAFVLGVAAAGFALADEARDGEALAERLCAKCHVVSENVGPPFAEIAKGPHASPGALQDFLRSTHADVSHLNAMPSPGLSEQEIEALAAYIASLRKPE